MLETIKKVAKCFDIKSSTPWIVLILGTIALFAGFQKFIDIGDICKEILLWTGSTLISGVIIGFMTSYAQYKGLFKNELEDVLYKYDFLKRRRDINEIWENVSLALFESKFPEISYELLNTIKDSYLPIQHANYCKDADTIITIRWHDKDNNIIEVVSEESFNIIASSTNEFLFPGAFSIDVNPSFSDISEIDLSESRAEEIDSSIKIDKCEVNGSEIDYNHSIYLKDGSLQCYTEIKLEGSQSYFLDRVMTKRYNLTYDYNIGFRAKTILKDLRVRVFNEIHDDIELCFIGRGVLNNYKEVKKRNDYLEKEYKGLILQKQGFIIILKDKK